MDKIKEYRIENLRILELEKQLLLKKIKLVNGFMGINKDLLDNMD